MALPPRPETITDTDLRRFESWERFLESLDDRVTAWDDAFRSFTENTGGALFSSGDGPCWEALASEGLAPFLMVASLLLAFSLVVALIRLIGRTAFYGPPAVCRRLVSSLRRVHAVRKAAETA